MIFMWTHIFNAAITLHDDLQRDIKCHDYVAMYTQLSLFILCDK